MPNARNPVDADRGKGNKEIETMKLEICCKDMLEEWNNGNIELHEDGYIEWMDMGDIRFCPFCGEKFDYEVTIKNKGVE